MTATVDPKTLCRVPEVQELVQHLRRVVQQCPHLAHQLIADINDPHSTIETQEGAIVRTLESLGFVAEFQDVKQGRRTTRRGLAVGIPVAKSATKKRTRLRK
jgi:hypothetical protein